MLRKIRNIFYGGHHVQVNGDYNQNVYQHATSVDITVRKEEALRKLFDHIAPGALHNSAERFDPPKCHPETRRAILRMILEWAKDPNNLRLLMWIYGPAGAGKSSIMQSIAELLEEDGTLGGSFFFFRTGEKRNTKTHFVTTLAYQLALTVPHFGEHLAAAINHDPSIFSRTLTVQMKALVMGPIMMAAASDQQSYNWTYVLLVDGLDECAPHESQREIIHLLSNCVSSHFRILIASRPEYAIRESFNTQTVSNQIQRLALDNRCQPDADIRLYLVDKFHEIRSRNSFRLSIPNGWPSQDDLNTLVRNSSGQFIYAATIIRFIDSHRHNPVVRLATVLKARVYAEDTVTPFAQLDELYHQILASVDDIKKVLAIVHCLMFCTGGLETKQLEVILGYEAGECLGILCDMHSLLLIPDSNLQVSNNCIKFYHASFGDFLSDQLRATHLYVSPEKASASVATRIVNRFDDLKKISKYMDCVRLLSCALQSTNYLTEELVSAISGFNIQKGIRLSEFDFQHADDSEETMNLSSGMLYSMEIYYRNIIEQQFKKTSQTAHIYESAVSHLDIWLSEELHRYAWGPVNGITSIICLIMISNIPGKTLGKTFQWKFPPGRKSVTQILHDVVLNPRGASRQAIRTTIRNPFNTLYHPYLRHIEYMRRDEQGSLNINFNPTFVRWIKTLKAMTSEVEVLEETGKKLKYCQSIYSRRGKVDTVFLSFAVRLKSLQKDLHELAIAAAGYLKKCGIKLDIHDYNSQHHVCFSCQATEAFLHDTTFGNDFIIIG